MSNRESQKRWYARQKAKTGYIYRIICRTTGDCYIGSTTNSLNKRLWQAKASPRGLLKEAMEQYGKDDFYIEELECVHDKDKLREAEQRWMNLLDPELNIQGAIFQAKEPLGSYKGGVWVNEQWYPTKKAAWEAVGKVTYGTMKSRFHKTKDLEFALGLK